MRLLEYQAKELFKKYGINVPNSLLINNVEELEGAKNLGFPLVLKAQLPVGGRGKSGAIVKVKNESELKQAYLTLRNKTIQGLKVDKILAESFFNHTSEFYVSYFENRSDRCFSIIATAAGGIEVEEVKEKFVSNFGLEGPSDEQLNQAASYLGFNGVLKDRCVSLMKKLYKVFDESEAELVEINPLAVSEGDFAALDAKIILDDNALFRRPELKPYLPEDVSVEEAEKFGFNFVPLDGDVAVVGNGAGLVLATLDMVSSIGLSPACFLDLGGGASPERVQSALEFLSTSLPNMKILFINVFGGITNSVSVAQGFLEAKGRGFLNKPFFLRLSGAGEIEARELLRKNGINSFIDIEDALKALKEYGKR
ncbi:MAG: succinate--CoA ligase subunit beta [Nitrososphaerota archaeon]